MDIRGLCIGLLGLSTLLVTGCGDNGSAGPEGSTITVTFTGAAPLAVAEQIGPGAWTTASPQASKLTLTIPSGTANAKYAIAFICQLTYAGGFQFNQEFVIEATPQDGTAYAVSLCPPSTPVTGFATGSVNATAIAGATNVLIYGAGALPTSVNANNGSFSAAMATGTNDVAAVAVDGASNVLGVKILRSQTVPGALNGGSPIVFAASDATTMQSISVTNLPPGFNQPGAGVSYRTVNNTLFTLSNNAQSQYAAVPASEAQSSDYYSFFSSAYASNGSRFQFVQTSQTATAAGPVTLSLPAVLSAPAPTAAAFPTFSINDSVFQGLPAVGYEAMLRWNAGNSGPGYQVGVTATAAYQAGTTSISIPNLTALPGFFAMAPSGTSVHWIAAAWGGTRQSYAAVTAASPNSSLSYADTQDEYTQP